ncbi:MAG TPA: hypothetical protein VFJ50_01900 [Gemmatimonadales bacterium]|nr:hypothetical protein [Gemmatimonadales bacterium]
MRRRAARVKRQEQARQAHAQEGQYVSQGRAVQRAAQQQRTQQQTRGARPLAQRPVTPRPVARPKPVQAKPLQAKPPRAVRAGKPVRTQRQAQAVNRAAQQQAQVAAAQRARALAAVAQSGGEFDSFAHVHAEREAANAAAKVRREQRRASAVAPALKVLDQTTRVSHAIAAAAKEDVKTIKTKGLSHYLAHGSGSRSIKAAERGFQLKDRTVFSDVLKEAGVKNKAVRAAAGFALDVGTDPTTITTGGVGSVAEHAAATAAAKTAAKAAKAGMSEEGIRTVAHTAARRAAAAAPKGRGISVKLAGQEVPGVRRATAAVGRAAARPVRKVAPVASRTVPANVRKLAREFAPRARPAAVSEQEFQTARAAARSARATVNAAEQRALTLAQQAQRRLKPEEHRQVIDAIERNDLSRLPTKELAQTAHQIRSALKGSRRVSKRAGVAAGHKAGDISRFLTAADEKRLAKTVAAEQRTQKRTISRASTKEQAARERALLTEQADVLGAREATKVAQVRERGRSVAERERQAGRAKVATERVRGREAKGVAVSRERAIAQARASVVEARRRLKVELAKPVTKRKGVAALEATVRRAEQTWRDARRPVNAARMSAVRPKVSVRAVEAVAPATSRRAGNAAERYEQRAASTLTAQQRLRAAQRIPERGIGESHEAWLRRVIAHAERHNLPLVRQGAEKLLAKAPTDVARGYFPREYDARILKQLGLTAEDAATRTVRGPSRKVAPTTAGFARSEQRRLAVVNPELEAAGKVPHSEDIPLVVLNHMRQAARATSQGEFAKAMAKAGRKVTSTDELMPGEQLYKLGYQGKQFGLHAVRDIPKKLTKGGQYVALNRDLLEAMQGQTRQAQAHSMAGHVWDAATGTFKRVATATIGFHVRNLIGDTQQHYLATPAYRIPGNIRAAGKAVRRASEQTRTTMPTATDATVKVAGERQGIDEFLKGARENGVLDTGYIGREIHDLGQRATDQAKKVKGGRARGAFQTIDRWMTNRENLMRLATYKAGLDQGMTPAKAADLANLIHVDYGELSEVERRVMRRVFPFYTWTARSLPVHATMLVTKPGKFATIEKAREETAAGFGMNEDANRRGMNETIGRQLPFVVKIGHGAQGVSFSLPATLLNELPTGASPQALNAWLNEVGRFTIGMVNPIIKMPTELYLGVSAYTKRPIEDPHRPLVAAPSWVQWLPRSVKRELDVTPNFVEKRTGKKTWGWRGLADWASRQIPGAPQQVGTVVSGGRPGQPKNVGTAVAGAAGIRIDSLNAAAVKRTAEVKVLERLAKLNREAAKLNQQGINHDNPTPEYTHLRAQINALTKQVRPRKTKKVRRVGPLPLGGGGGGGKLPLGGGSAGGKLPLGGG